MTLFAPDLYRSFAIGFLGAGLVLVATTDGGFGPFTPNLVPEAQAAQVAQPVNPDIEVAEEFLITQDTEETQP